VKKYEIGIAPAAECGGQPVVRILEFADEAVLLFNAYGLHIGNSWFPHVLYCIALDEIMDHSPATAAAPIPVLPAYVGNPMSGTVTVTTTNPGFSGTGWTSHI
jgi:hypothetical protein